MTKDDHHDISYGPVRVIAGEHKGKVGYYDDEGDEEGTAIVYFEKPFEGPYTVIPLCDLAPAENSLELERFVRDHPELAQEAGVRARRPKPQ